MTDLSSRIPVRPETLSNIKSLKRGGESYDELLTRLYAKYEDSTETDEECH